MGDEPEFRRAGGEQSRYSSDEETGEFESTQPSLQQIAHDRGRICKKRGCVVCAPLRERRRERKSERRAEARAQRHDRGEPCGRSDCEIAVCVEARRKAEAADGGTRADASPIAERPRSGDKAAATASAERRPGDGVDASSSDAERARRRQAERHRVGLPCGSELCPDQVCVDGFANERTRRHRAGRPCRATTCDSEICVAARRSSN